MMNTQVGAGAAILGAFGYGLYLKDSPSGRKATEARTQESGQADLLLELEREAQQSSGKYWFGEDKDRKIEPPG